MLNNYFINLLFKKGNKISDKTFTLFYEKINKNIDQNYSITIDNFTKIKPIRNRIKRICKEILRDIDVPKHYIINIHVRKRFLKNRFLENKDDLISIFEKLKKII